MKKEFLKYIPVYVLSLFIIVFIIFARNSADDKESNTKKELNGLYEQYDDGLLKAFLSLNELRPFSIIQFDKFSDKYDNEWTSPTKMAERLNRKDRELLISRVAGYVDRLKDKQKASDILNKLKYWCIADEQFYLLKDKIGLSDDIVFKALSQVAGTSHIFTQEKDNKLKDVSNMNSNQIEHLYIETINYISGLSLNEQLKCYGEVYNQLSVLTMK